MNKEGHINLHHWCRKGEAEAIIRDGFNPPVQERLVCAVSPLIPPCTLGQQGLDRVSLGIPGLTRPWRRMKEYQAEVNGSLSSAIGDMVNEVIKESGSGQGRLQTLLGKLKPKASGAPSALTLLDVLVSEDSAKAQLSHAQVHRPWGAVRTFGIAPEVVVSRSDILKIRLAGDEEHSPLKGWATFFRLPKPKFPKGRQRSAAAVELIRRLEGEGVSSESVGDLHPHGKMMLRAWFRFLEGGVVASGHQPLIEALNAYKRALK